MHKPILIIIRGNSGSGKSTLAKELRLRMVEQGMNTALVEQDYLRRIVLKEKEVTNGDNIKLIEQTVRFALNHGYSAVLEGILAFCRYGAMLKRLRKCCGGYFVYYMDIPFEETLRRHKTKPNAHEFGEKEMREWWRDRDLTNFPEEKVIPDKFTLRQSIEFILRDIEKSL
jgi:adenylylsulfate kinase-like enzyme